MSIDPAYWLRLCEAHDGPVQIDSKKLAALCRRLLELEAK